MIADIPPAPPAYVETVDYMTASQFNEFVYDISSALDGETVANANGALGTVQELTNTGGITVFNRKISVGPKVSVYAANAAQAWQYFKLTRDAYSMTALGAAAMTIAPEAYGVLFGNPALAGTLAGSGGLLTASIPAAASAMAPLLGVSLGNVLYNSNPELWTKISQTLLPFCYKDKEVMPVVTDADGTVYYQEEALEALRDLFVQEGIGAPPQSYTQEGFVAEGITFTGECTAYKVVRGNAVGADGLTKFGTIVGDSAIYYYFNNQDGSAYFFSEDDFEVWITRAHAGGIGLYGSYVSAYDIYVVPVSGSAIDATPITVSTISPNNHDPIVAAQILGHIPAGEFPVGTSEWLGDHVDVEDLASVYVVNDKDSGTLSKFVEGTLSKSGYTSNDYTENPSPTAKPSDQDIEKYMKSYVEESELPAKMDIEDMAKYVAPFSINDPMYVKQADLDVTKNPSSPPAVPTGTVDPTVPPPSSGITPIIDFPPVGPWPSIVPSSGPGLVHVYNPTPQQFTAFGNWLWVTYADASIQKIWNNPFDGIIGAHELYATPSQDGTDTIKSGFLDSGVQSTIVRQRYTQIDCGSILIPEWYGNYLDYSPYSKAYIYLPFIGIVEVEVDDIVGHVVNVTYHVDSYNGSCIAQITVAKDDYVNTIYQYSGNCSVDIPLSGGSQAAIKAGIISAAAYGIGSTINGIINGASFGALGGGMGAGKGGLVGGVTGAISGVASGIANAVSQKSSVQHSGTFGASYGAMGIKTPYIIIRRPIQKFVPLYQNDYGFPAHKRVIIGECTGYLRVREVNVVSSLATDDEKALIEQLLKSGVYIS